MTGAELQSVLFLNACTLYSLCQSNLVQLWQALLRARVHPARHSSDVTLSSELAVQLALIVIGFLDLQNKSFKDAVEQQKSRLSFVAELWKTMRGVIASSQRASSAETILAAILKLDFSLTVPEVKNLWGRLCADLISSSTPAFFTQTCVRNEDQRTLDVKRHLWAVLAKQWESGRAGLTWEDSMKCLALPLRYTFH